MTSFKAKEDLSPLLVATLNRNGSEVESLIQENSGMLQSDGPHALYQACLRNYGNIVKILLKTSLIFDLSSDIKIDIIMDTVKKGHADILKLLLESGFADSVKETNTPCTVLFHACVLGKEHMVQKLVTMSNVNETAMEQVTPLMTAALYKHHKILSQLIHYGAKVNAQASDGTTALMCAILSKDAKTVKLLLQYGADTGQAKNEGTTPLMLATKTNQIHIVKTLLKKSSREINMADSNGMSALMIACENVDANEDMLNLLIKHGADVDKEIDERKVFLWASFHGFLDTIKLILLQKQDINTKGPSSETAVMIAAEQGFLKIVKYLTSKKADVDIVSSYLGTALHYAAATNREDVVRHLIGRKPKIFKNQNGKTPSLVAKHNKHSAVQKVLEEYERKRDVLPYPGTQEHFSSDARETFQHDTSSFVNDVLTLLKQHMYTPPLVFQFFNNELLSAKEYEDLRSMGPVAQAEYVTENVIALQLKERNQAMTTVIQQALVESRNHVNKSLAKLLMIRDKPNCMKHEGWKVFLNEKEQRLIKKDFSETFIQHARVDEIILHLRQQNALDDWRFDNLKSLPSQREKAVVLVHDILVRGTVQTLNHFRQALQATIRNSTDSHLCLMNCLPPARGATSFVELFDRRSTARISQQVLYYQDRMVIETRNKATDVSQYQRKLRENEFSGLRVSVKEKIRQYEHRV